MNGKKLLAGSALLAVGALVLSACAGGGSDSGSADGDVSMTLWQNSTTGPGQQFWKDAIAAFEEANPGVTIEMQSVQNEDMDGKLQTALNAGDAPDIFLQRGGGKMTAMVNAGQLMDLTGVSDDIKNEIPEGSFAAETYQDKVWAMPLSVLPGGFFYSQDAFANAGITETPGHRSTTSRPSSASSRDPASTPIALGAKDAWPAAHWYYFFALRECSPKERSKRPATRRTSTTTAGCAPARTCRRSRRSEPFNDGFLTTAGPAGRRKLGRPDRQPSGRDGAHGRVGPGCDRLADPRREAAAGPRLVPVPRGAGGEGEPGSMMGGVDGYSCCGAAHRRSAWTS